MTSVRKWRPPSPSTGPSAIEESLKDLEARLTRLDHDWFLSEWALHTGGSRAGSLGTRLARAALLSHPELLLWCRESLPHAASARVRRRLELLEQRVLESQLADHPPIARLEERISRKVLGFRPRWKGRRVSQAEIWDLASKEEDPGLRKEGYYANEPLYAAVEYEVRQLLRARNDRSRELGFRDFPEARLSLDGLSIGALRELMRPFAALARPLARAVKDRSASREWYPWEVLFTRWREGDRTRKGFSGEDCHPAVRHGLRAWGFRVADLSFAFRRCDTPTAGMAVIGDAPRDVGVIANPRDGLVYYSVLFHEMGHGIHARSVRGSSHLLRGGPTIGSPGFSEALAGLFEFLTMDERWLRTRPGVTRADAARIRRSSYEGLAIRMAELVGEIQTELKLYANPEADVLAERSQFLRHTFGYDDHPPVSWVDPYHLRPGFLRQSYLWGTCFDEQVLAAAVREVGGNLWPNRRLGPWLKRTWFRPGQRDDWVEKTRRVTGKPLGPEAFVRAVRQAT